MSLQDTGQYNTGQYTSTGQLKFVIKHHLQQQGKHEILRDKCNQKMYPEKLKKTYINGEIHYVNELGHPMSLICQIYQN